MEGSGDSNGSSAYSSPTSIGMTSAISTAGPKPYDIKLTQELMDALQPLGCFESDEEMNHRMEVLSKLDGLVKRWVRELSIVKNMPPAIAEQVLIIIDY
jgi:poly(A) polymerase